MVDELFFSNGYTALGTTTQIMRDGELFYIQKYGDTHHNEYTLFNDQKMMHYNNGLLEICCNLKNQEIDGELIVFKNGLSKYRQKWYSSKKIQWIRILNCRVYNIKEIYDALTQKVIYRGVIDDLGKRSGRGFEFDGDTGTLKSEGYWLCDKLYRIFRIFEGNKMTEFQYSESNIKILSRIPIYVGGYFYDKTENACYRNGEGYILNQKGIAICKGKWKKGKEVSIIQLNDGWYHLEDENQLKFNSDCELLLIPAKNNSPQSVFNLYSNHELKMVNIEEENYCLVQHFSICDLNSLEVLNIGSYSFYNNDRSGRINRTFSITDCDNLRSIKIGVYSFQFFSGEFKLCNLPSLESITIGQFGIGSSNFSFYLPKLKTIVLGDHSFESQEEIELSNLPSLEIIELGWTALSGWMTYSSLVMKDLPKLNTIKLQGSNFIYVRNVTLKNIMNVKHIIMNSDSSKDDFQLFPLLKNKHVQDVSPILRKHISIRNSLPSGTGVTFANLAIDFGQSVINIPERSCNDTDVFIDINKYLFLKELIIGEHSFMKVTEININNLNELKTIIIHSESFTSPANSVLKGSFSVSNCRNLETIVIDYRSCIHFNDDFTLSNLPSLRTLRIGKIGEYSTNFFKSSFGIKDLPKLESVVLGNETFQRSLITSFENLPSLRTIELGNKALMGCNDEQCKVVMKELPKLEKIFAPSGCFRETRILILENIRVSEVQLDDYSFKKTSIVSVMNISNQLMEYMKHTPLF